MDNNTQKKLSQPPIPRKDGVPQGKPKDKNKPKHSKKWIDWESEPVLRALKITKEIYIKVPYSKRKQDMERVFEKITGVYRSWGTIKDHWKLLNKKQGGIKKHE